MRSRGCLLNLLFAFAAVIVFGGSTYFWFNFFVKGKSLPTPNLVGKSVAQAKAICSDLGVTLNVDQENRRNSDKVPAGNVAWQNRDPGATNLIKRGTTIRVELSAGPLVLRVPELGGQSPRTALLRLAQQNLKLGNLAYVESAPNAQGILAEDPPRDTVVGAQTPVSLLVGMQPTPRPFVMPDLIDQALDVIRPQLESHGLAVSTVKFEAYPGIRDGIVIRQFPLRGSPVSARDPITLVVTRQESTSIIEQPGGAAVVPAPTATQ
jgi:beta-lactam-binding protein with PASTA domain